jgi:hypothetical protein
VGFHASLADQGRVSFSLNARHEDASIASFSAYAEQHIEVPGSFSLNARCSAG